MSAEDTDMTWIGLRTTIGYMPRYMSQDMPQVTLTMLQRLDDFEEYIRKSETKLKDNPPESSRMQSQDVQLRNILGSIGALKQSIRMYRDLWWKEKDVPRPRKTG